MTLVGRTHNGQKLFGYKEDGVTYYYLNSRFVALAMGDCETASSATYYCLHGIWANDSNVQVVGEETLNSLIEG